MEGRATYPGRQFDQWYPNFGALLQRRYTHICVWVFDIMFQHGKDLRPLPLFDRRRKLDALMSRVRCDAIRHSEAFADPHQLLAACAARKLEGIVQSEQMRRTFQDRPTGAEGKVPCMAEANQWRHDFFEKRR